MQIQLIGLPASGKSTLAEDLVKTYPDFYVLGEKKYTSFKKMVVDEPWHVLHIIGLCLPILPSCILGVRKSEIDAVGKATAIVGLMLNLANYEAMIKTNEQQNKIIVWDELLLQRALSIFAYSTAHPNKKVICSFVKWAIKVCSCTPVFVSCESSTQEERLFKRGVPVRMEKLGLESVRGIMLSHQRLIDTMVCFFENVMLVNTGLAKEKNLLTLHWMVSNQL